MLMVSVKKEDAATKNWLELIPVSTPWLAMDAVRPFHRLMRMLVVDVINTARKT